MKDLNINYSVSEADEIIQSLQEKITQSKEKESVKLLKKYSKETNSKYIELLCQQVSLHMEKLNRTSFPKNGLCTHFGIGFSVKNDYVQISPRSYNDNRTLFTIYRNSNRAYLPNGIRFGNSKEDHQKKMRAISALLGRVVLDYWNGEDNQEGISFVLDLDCPKSLKTVCLNYHNLESVFNLTKKQEECFKKWDKWIKE